MQRCFKPFWNLSFHETGTCVFVAIMLVCLLASFFCLSYDDAVTDKVPNNLFASYFIGFYYNCLEFVGERR